MFPPCFVWKMQKRKSVQQIIDKTSTISICITIYISILNEIRYIPPNKPTKKISTNQCKTWNTFNPQPASWRYSVAIDKMCAVSSSPQAVWWVLNKTQSLHPVDLYHKSLLFWKKSDLNTLSNYLKTSRHKHVFMSFGVYIGYRSWFITIAVEVQLAHDHQARQFFVAFQQQCSNRLPPSDAWSDLFEPSRYWPTWSFRNIHTSIRLTYINVYMNSNVSVYTVVQVQYIYIELIEMTWSSSFIET